jgi:hypothetical protein
MRNLARSETTKIIVESKKRIADKRAKEPGENKKSEKKMVAEERVIK